MKRTRLSFRVLNISLLLAMGAVAAVMAQGKPPAPLSIARQGYLFAGGKYSTVNGRQVMSGQLYAEFQIPSQPVGCFAPRHFHVSSRCHRSSSPGR